MAKRPRRQAITLEQLVYWNMLQMEALVELLGEKRLLTKQELADRAKKLQVQAPKEPFHGAELLTRVRAAVLGPPAMQTDADKVISIGDLELDIARRRLLKSGVGIHLTATEFDLLHCLMSHAGKPVSHARLLSSVWGIEHGSQIEYLRTYVGQLRRKLEDDTSHPEYLLTEIHIGYRFNDTIRRRVTH